MSDPNGILWALCCGWLLLPIVLAVVAYRWMMRLGHRRLNVIHEQETKDGRKVHKWFFEIDEKVVPIMEEEPKE